MWGPLLPYSKRFGGVNLWRLPIHERREMLRKAICQGTRIQLRSILLTSGTTIAGLLPLLIRLTDAEGKDIWENLALSSIGGLASSTILIVGTMPVLYWLFTHVGWSLAVAWSKLRGRWPVAVPAEQLRAPERSPLDPDGASV